MGTFTLLLSVSNQNRVVAGGKGVDVTVVDSCPGCGRDDIDLSPAAFKKLAPLSQGVVQVTWKFLAQ